MVQKKRFIEIRVTEIDRQKFAVVPLNDYKAYLKATLMKPKHVRPRPSFLDKRPDVAAFFRDNLDRQSLLATRDECAKRFGEKNTPSRAVAYRYWQKLRKERAVDASINLVGDFAGNYLLGRLR